MEYILRSQYFKNIINSVNSGFYITNPQGKILFANNHLIKILDFNSLEELQEINLEELSCISKNYSRENFKKILTEKGQIVDFVSSWENKNGERIIVKENCKIVYDEESKATYYQGVVEDITEKNNIIKKLQTSEDIIQQVFDFSPIGIRIIDTDFNIIKTNKKYREYNEMINNDKQIDKKCFEYLCSEDCFSDECTLRQIQDGKELVEKEFVITLENGDTKFFSITSVPYKDKKDKIIGIIENFTDVTKAKLTELKINKSKEEYKNLVENVPIGLYKIDIEGNIIMANKALIKMLEYENFAELSKKNLHKDIIDAEDRIMFKEILLERLEVKDFKTIWTTKKNVKIFVNEDVKAVFDENGNLSFYEGSVIDITPKVKAKQKEKKYQDLLSFLSLSGSQLIELKTPKKIYNYLGINLQKLLENSMIFIGKFTDNKTIVIDDFYGINQSDKKEISEILNIELDKTEISINEEFNEIIFPNKIKEIKNGIPKVFLKLFTKQKIIKLLKAIKKNKLYTIGIERENKILSAIFILTKNRLGFESKNFIETITYQASIALYRHILDNNLIQEKEKAEKANVAKSEFLANMSHEIRTPMNSILGFSEILKTKISDKQQRNYVDNIYKSGKILLELINDILDLSKLEAGKIQINTNNCNIRNLLNEVYNIFIVEFTQKDIEFSYFIEEKIPDVIIIDEGRLRQIMFNLIGNALKFTEKGSVKVEVSEENFKEDVFDLIIKISDTGIGIPQKNFENIFDAFKQVDGTTNRRFGGTGLGLPITKRLTEMLNGKIIVDSEINKGSTFQVIMPNTKCVLEQEIIDNCTIQSNPEDLEFENAKILVAEDIQLNREMLNAFFEDHNFEIVEAENGKIAIEKTFQTKPDIILMDVQMPEVDGISAAKKIKESAEFQHIPIIALSAYNLNESNNKIDIFDDYLKKPIVRNDLFCVLVKYLKLKENQKNKNNDKEEDKYANIIKEIENEFNNYEFNQEFYLIFNSKILKKYDEIKDSISFDETISFAEEIINFGENFKIETFNHYGTILLDALNSFKLREIKNILAIFEKIKKIILQ